MRARLRSQSSSHAILGATFSIETENPGYAPKTAGPFTPKSGWRFHEEICLEPAK